MNGSGLCQCCEVEPAHNGNECRMCHAVLTAVCYIRNAWSVDEYKALGDALNKCPLDGFIADARIRNASASVRLGMMLIRLCRLSGKSEDEFKVALFRRMTRDRAELESIRRMPGGTDGWNKRVAAHLGAVREAVNRTARKSHV